MKRGQPMRRTELKRATGMRQRGTPYATRADALASPEAEAGGFVPRVKGPDGSFHVRPQPARKTGIVAARAAAVTQPRAPKPRRAGAATGLPKPPRGFSRAVRLAVRARAGGGDPVEAVCEACGVHLGRLGGQMQHIVARGMGGSADPVINGTAGAALLCGTPQSGCHGAAEAGDEEMRGFWLPFGTDPRDESMTLHDGRVVRRSEDGRYLLDDPRGEAEAA